MDIWQLIERDHQNIAQLIREIPYALNGPGVIRSRERMLGDLMRELELHAIGLEASLHEPLSQESRTRSLIEELHRGHAAFMRQLRALARYRQKGAAGWLDTFEDVTFLVDQHLHRHVHELVPAARDLLGPEAVRNATRAYVRAKLRALRARRRRLDTWLSSGDFTLMAAICAAAAGIGLIAWRTGLLGSSSRSRSQARGRATAAGRATGATPTPRALNDPPTNKDPQRRGENRYGAMLRQALADIENAAGKADDPGFLADEVIYKTGGQRDPMRDLVLAVLEDANVGFSQYGYQAYLSDRTLTQDRQHRSEHPSVSFRIARSTLPIDLIARQAHQFIFDAAPAQNEIRFRVLNPGTAAHAGDAAGRLRDGGDLNSETLQEILAKALRVALANPV